MSVDRYQTCLICATISSAIFFKIIKRSVAKVKVAQNRHVCDHSERKLLAVFYTYPIIYSLKYAKNIKITMPFLCNFSNH